MQIIQTQTLLITWSCYYGNSPDTYNTTIRLNEAHFETPQYFGVKFTYENMLRISQMIGEDGSYFSTRSEYDGFYFACQPHFCFYIK